MTAPKSKPSGDDRCSASPPPGAASTHPTWRTAVTMVWLASSASKTPSALSLITSTVWSTWSHSSRNVARRRRAARRWVHDAQLEHAGRRREIARTIAVP